MRIKIALILSFIFMFAGIFPDISEAQEMVRILPERTDELLVNPGKGISTFQHFNGDPLFPGRWSEQGPLTFNQEIISLENRDYPQTSLSYCRWYWDVLEPVKGEYAWDLIDNSLLQAHRHGQTLQIRMMPQSHRGTQIPEWYMEEANGFVMEEFDEEVWQPDYLDPKFVEYWGALIREFGQRYDGHPWLESVDLGALGYWGEWHTWTRPGMMPPWEIKKQLIDIYLESFQETPLLMLIGDEQGLAYAVQHGTGWRADSLGDPMYCEPWCEMNDRYPMRIAGTGSTDVWKTAPVVFEVGRTFARHLESGWEIDNTIAEALRWHVSSVNAKSSAIPAEWMPRFEEFIKRMGYRFELRKMEYQANVRSGSLMPVHMWWVNTGVAPIYRRYNLAVQLWSPEASGMIQIKTDLTKWLPGDDIIIEDRFFVPELPAGKYRIRVGLLDSHSGKPAVKLPIKGRTPDNWHDLGEILVSEWKLK